MAGGFLLFDNKVTLNRFQEGYYDSDHNYIAGGSSPVVVDGSVQPYREGKDVFTRPAGMMSSDALVIYSLQPIITYDEHSKVIADEYVFDGNTYYARDQEKAWNTHSFGGVTMIPNHYKTMFYKKDLV